MIRIVQISAREWAKWSEKAHLVVFGERSSAEMDRFDFTLVSELEENSRMLGYVTCREFDSKSLYWQYGGAFPGTKSTSLSYPAYQKMVAWCASKYDRVMTLVENQNYPMLKMHLKNGFLIVGFRVHKGVGMVELVKEFEHAA